MRQLFRPFKLTALPILLVAITSGCGDFGSENATLTRTDSNRDVFDSAGAAIDSNSSAAPVQKFKVGDTVNFETFEVTIKTVEELTTVGNQFLKEDVADGGTFVAITYTLKNTGKSPIGVFDGPKLKLIDATGTSYNPDDRATSMFSLQKKLNSKSTSDLNPGIKITDGSVWEISKDQFDRATWKVILDGHENSPISLN